jgi:serine phosphatase RsbU (regulator of sigma subunit)
MIRVERPRVRSSDALRPARAIGEPVVTRWYSAAGGAPEGGDWCDAVVRSDGIIAFTIGDVSGHGAAVAGTMRSVRTSVLDALRFVREPSAVLTVANGFVFDHLDGQIVTAVVALFDRRRRTLTYANAGHPPPLILTEERTSYLWQPPADLPLGIFPHYFARTHSVNVPEDSLLLLYTDGITEHGRDIVAGELELAQTARSLYAEKNLDDARAIAERMLDNGRGDDDAALMVLRSPRHETFDR